MILSILLCSNQAVNAWVLLRDKKELTKQLLAVVVSK
jgi:hypothetical protein